ncbi:MAG: PBECR4 domain-containing protein [Butyrivibrio sp.]|nr:PBECR4 domain-containing protein [Muribaculum sp.]MCM1552071.1 PBECR4 domain-containing protein [Butyrivibrio sp.]
MDKLLECAKAYEKLLDVQYRIVIGRKGKTEELCIRFSKWDFHHLVGLGKLKDLRLARKNRRLVFDDILEGKITYENISVSRYINQIENRFVPFMHIKDLLDDNRLIFRYNIKLNRFSLIEADYVLSTPHEGNDIYIFLAKEKDNGFYFCRSFFPREQKDYTRGQAAWTMLYKERIHLSTGESQIQYDRLNIRH